MKRYTDDKKVITATEKAYEALYKARGYRPISALGEPSGDEQPTDSSGDQEITTGDQKVAAMEDMSKDDIIKVLEERGIPFKSRDNKKTLYNLMVGAD